MTVLPDQLPASDPQPPIDALLEVHRRARLRRRILVIVILGALGALGAYSIHLRQREHPVIARYDTVQAVRGPLTVKVTATGTLQPVTQVDVGTEVSGTVESVLVDFNDHVSAGQVLARLDTTQLAAKERQSMAALRLAEARVLDARATAAETAQKLRRSEKLLAQKLTPQEDYDTTLAADRRAAAGIAVAEAQVNQAQAQLDYDQRLLQKAVILSPINGIVLKRQIEPGQTVAATLQTPVLFTLAENLTQMQLHVQIDEADVGKVAAGQSAEFTVDAYPERRFPAAITLVRYVPQTVEGVVTYETLMSVDNSALLLRPGMTVTAEITVQHKDDVLLVPNAALRFIPPAAAAPAAATGTSLASRLMWRPPPIEKRVPDDASTTTRVWVLRGNEAQPVAVGLGATDGVRTEITSGALSPGAEVIVGVRSSAP